ncbi:di-heme oxidoredictase family protein [Jiella sonneratiae]|uniref:Cytochrome c domain-containing protein n=1 Tax=Jiella sonneratiae TaxID=2816856 RepID=A0ABS3J728_9HYPH|nr:di-heme oxidoredictase family protein [Jiella sonneratiae]MBO0905473.1 hypothetical protein [Jiella sonneratiae]
MPKLRNAILAGTALCLVVGASSPLRAQLSDAINDTIFGGGSGRGQVANPPAVPDAGQPPADQQPPVSEQPPADQQPPAGDTTQTGDQPPASTADPQPQQNDTAGTTPQPVTPAAGDDQSAPANATPNYSSGGPTPMPGGSTVPVHLTTGDEPSLGQGIRLSQEEISAGNVGFRSMMEIGRHLFTQSFTAVEGYGEGPTGPREKKRHQMTASGIGPMAAFAQIPWMRVHGLDAQACLECHNVSGFETPVGGSTPGRTVRPDRVSGAGAVTSAAIINPLLELPAPKWVVEAFQERGVADPGNMYAVFLRNPPHVFGAGYTQKLAEEMSFDLLAQRRAAVDQATQNRGQWYEIRLNSKGTDFGRYQVRVNAGAPAPGELLAPCGQEQSLVERCDRIEGVSEDFVVRPFQWKGIASNMRNFVRDALNFHFGMVPEELIAAGANPDPDGDGIVDEVSIGEVTALTAFALGARPPSQIAPADSTEIAAVARGRAIFEGRAGGDPTTACVTCHQSSKTVLNPVVRIHDPRPDRESLRVVARESNRPEPALTVTENGVGLGQAAPRGLPLPVEQEFLEGGQTAAKERAVAPAAQANESAGRGFPKGAAFAFNLNMNTPFEEKVFLASEPRLASDVTGAVDVPLFSDLKRHKMGRCLADVIHQQTDRAGVFVPRDQYVTRALWGLADTGPWLHDGRALSLRDAILKHSDAACADNGSGFVSEANGAVTAFQALPAEDQDALLAFLHTLRLPRDEGFAGVDQNR